MNKFAGATYDPALDDARLEKQLGRVYEAMRDGHWRTLEEIQQATARIQGAPQHGDPAASISAQLRHLKKEQHGGYTLNKRIRGDRASGLYEYQILPPAKPQQQAQVAAVQSPPPPPIRTAFRQDGQGYLMDLLAR